MNKIKQLFVALALIVVNPMAGNASTFGSASTYSGIWWSLTTTIPGLTACNDLRLDGTGDLQNAASFVMSGALNCPALNGAYGVVGSLYIGANSTFNMNLLIGSGTAIQCLNMIGLSGNCVFSNSAGVVLGTGKLTFIS